MAIVNVERINKKNTTSLLELNVKFSKSSKGL